MIKRIIFLIFTITFCSCSSKEAIFNKMLYATFIKSNSNIWNFGYINTTKGYIRHSFDFTNESKDTLYISNIPIGCSCLSAEFSKNIILPKSKFSVKISYNPSNKKGITNHKIMVIFNEGKYYTYVTIKGFIK